MADDLRSPDPNELECKVDELGIGVADCAWPLFGGARCEDELDAPTLAAAVSGRAICAGEARCDPDTSDPPEA